jgi:hypothetical protein
LPHSRNLIVVIQTPIAHVVIHPTPRCRDWRTQQSVHSTCGVRIWNSIHRNTRRHLSVTCDFHRKIKRLIEIERRWEWCNRAQLRDHESIAHGDGLNFRPKGRSSRNRSVDSKCKRKCSCLCRTSRIFQTSLISNRCWNRCVYGTCFKKGNRKRQNAR